MLVAKEIVNQRGILAHGLGSVSIGHPRGLHDSLVASVIIHHADKSLVQYLEFLVQNLFRLGHDAMSH